MSGTVKLTLQRSGVVYARGTGYARHGKLVRAELLSAGRVSPGLYRLTIVYRNHGASGTASHVIRVR
jgi:hypothetical protein